jgi:hypothetical protein
MCRYSVANNRTGRTDGWYQYEMKLQYHTSYERRPYRELRVPVTIKISRSEGRALPVIRGTAQVTALLKGTYMYPWRYLLITPSTRYPLSISRHQQILTGLSSSVRSCTSIVNTMAPPPPAADDVKIGKSSDRCF